jgi:hypothetical protein
MAVSPTFGLTPGHVIVGEFLGVDTPRSFTRRDGSDGMTRPTVRLLVGRRVESIPFRDMDGVAAALGTPAERDMVAVPVYVQGPWDEAQGRSGAHNASFTGRVPRDAD